MPSLIYFLLKTERDGWLLETREAGSLYCLSWLLLLESSDLMRPEGGAQLHFWVTAVRITSRLPITSPRGGKKKLTEPDKIDPLGVNCKVLSCFFVFFLKQ